MEREPNHFELAVFSLLWSEHCGYKHSALLLRRLPSDGPRVLQGPGENAGVVDLGEGLAVAFKVESHNHPSAVEPFQGAATGVGGILRDVSAMGARPVALLDGLRFGAPDDHFSRAVGGVGHYGNCVGVPNVGGEVVFDESYASNCLVNAMCVGLLPVERLTRAKATTARGARRPLRRDDGTGRDRRRVGAGERGARRGRRRQAAVGAGRRPVHREEADRGLGRARRARARAVAPGLRRGGSRVVALGDGGRLRHRRPPRPRSAARGGHGAVGGDDLRVAGADGRDRRSRSGSPRSRPCSTAGSSTAPSIGEVTETGVLRALLGGRGGRLDPRAAAHRRVPALPGRARAARSLRRRRRRAVPPVRAALLELLGSRAASLARLRLPALRPARPVAHGSAPRSRRRRSPAAAVVARASP